jgi:UDP-N-acetylglucosamine 2-epimerase (non-hydrolysing)
MKFVSIVGARPQFIKCAPLSREIRKEYQEILVHTGQHYDPDMSEIFFSELQIPTPDYNLGVGSATHGQQTGQMLMKIEKVLATERPDIVLVYGDTNSTLAGALAAAKLHIPLAHVEAGLRSYDRTMPEEINRVLTDHCSDLLFCPSQTAVSNLKREGLTKGVYFTGDIMVDALLQNRDLANEKSTILKSLNLKKKNFLLLTVHRPSNTDNQKNLFNIIKALGESGYQVIFPVHPRTKKILIKTELVKRLPPNISLINPLSYLDMLQLLTNATKVLTDSGGVQKEAFILKVPCVTLRENTEWIETLQDGWNILVGANCTEILQAIFKSNPLKLIGYPYGNGNAREKMMEILTNFSQ